MASFDERARDWDSPERMARAASVADALRAAVPLGPEMRVIEIGAGTGLLGLALRTDVGSVTLADPSAGMLAVAEERIVAQAVPNVHTLRYALTVDPLPEARFDLVVSLMAFHHVPDTDAALNGMFELLDPGGRLAVVDLDTEDGSFHSDPETDVHHGFDRERLRRRASAAGFSEIAFTTIHQIAKNERHYSLFLMTACRAPHRGPAEASD